MITILFENSIKHYNSISELSIDKLCFVKYEKPRVRDKQIVIEDLGYSRGTLLKTESIKYVYDLAETYSYRIDLAERDYVFIVDGSSGFDLGFSLYLVNKICNRINQPNILIVVEIPKLDSNIDVKARLYSWLKTILLHDIVVNRKGSMRIVFVDPNSPSQLVKYLVVLLTNSSLSEYRSLVHVKLKRFIIPIAELYFLTHLLTLYGKLDYLIEDYKTVLYLMHKVLDQAPTDLWSIARKSTSLIRGSIFNYKKILSSREELLNTMSELINLILKTSRFSESFVNPRELLDKLLSGYTISEIYSELFNSERIASYMNISRELLVDTYTYGVLTDCDYVRFAATGRDLFEQLPEGYNKVMLENIHSELNIFDICTVSLNTDCKYNASYIPFDFIEAYLEVSGLYLESLYPREIVFKNNIVKPIDIHNISLVNYSGFRKAISRKCRFSGLKLLKKIIK